MSLPRKPLNSQRLAEASDAVLLASSQARNDQPSDGSARRETMHPLEMLRLDRRPACLVNFTRVEIEEACRFLVRLGVLGSPPRRSAA